MSDEHLRRAALQLREAIRNEGSHPLHHRRIMDNHRKEWPTLWHAIDRIRELVEFDPPSEAT